MINISKGRFWDLPWSLVSSCSRCSPGCKNCWSLAMEKRFHKGIEGEILTHPERLSIPLKRRKPTVYACWNDLFHEAAPDDFIYDAYEKMASRPRHTFLVLTKRPRRMDGFIEHYKARRWPDAGAPVCDRMFLKDFDHIWHGLTVCNQQEADEKIPLFLQVSGKKFLSIEPMLGAIDLHLCLECQAEPWKCHEHLKVDGVVLGGETGPGARPMHPDWVRSVRDQCAAAGVPFFLKHLNKKDGRVLDGRTHDELSWRTL